MYIFCDENRWTNREFDKKVFLHKCTRPSDRTTVIRYDTMTRCSLRFETRRRALMRYVGSGWRWERERERNRNPATCGPIMVSTRMYIYSNRNIPRRYFSRRACCTSSYVHTYNITLITFSEFLHTRIYVYIHIMHTHSMHMYVYNNAPTCV